MREQRSQELWQQIGEVWHLSLPAILTQITTIAMQYIDSAMVGALGAKCFCCDRSGSKQLPGCLAELLMR